MERRELLKIGLGSATVWAAQRLAVVDPRAEAAGVTVLWFNGFATSGPQASIRLLICIAGRRVRGTAFSFDLTKVFRLAGTFAKGKVTLKVFQPGETAAVGTVKGTVRGSKLNGSLKLNGEAASKFSTGKVPLNKAKMGQFAGVYSATATDDGVTFEGTLTVRKNGTWQLREITTNEPLAGPAFPNVSGIFGITPNNGVIVSPDAASRQLKDACKLFACLTGETFLPPPSTPEEFILEHCYLPGRPAGVFVG